MTGDCVWKEGPEVLSDGDDRTCRFREGLRIMLEKAPAPALSVFPSATGLWDANTRHSINVLLVTTVLLFLGQVRTVCSLP